MTAFMTIRVGFSQRLFELPFPADELRDHNQKHNSLGSGHKPPDQFNRCSLLCKDDAATEQLALGPDNSGEFLPLTKPCSRSREEAKAVRSTGG